MYWPTVSTAIALFLPLVFATSLRAASVRDVLIYYANETAPDAREAENYSAFINWLQSSKAEKSQKMARALESDQVDFPQAVDEETSALRKLIPKCRVPFPTLIVTNRLMREGQYLLFDPASGMTAFKARPINAVSFDDYILTSNPLADRRSPAAVLVEAAVRFPTRDHRFVLITKSHGSQTHALTPRLARHHEDLTREQFEAALANESVELPDTNLGITKEEFFRVLEEAGTRDGMQFSLVFIESCRGIFEEGLAEKLPTNVRLLYASGDRYLKYQTLDYPALMERVDSQRPISQVLDEYLAPRYLALYRRPSVSRLWCLAWFMPLVAWVLWLLSRRFWRNNPNRRIRAAHE